MTALNINLTSRSFKTQYTEHMKALTQPLMKSNLAENIFNTNDTYNNIETNFYIHYQNARNKTDQTIRDI